MVPDVFSWHLVSHFPLALRESGLVSSLLSSSKHFLRNSHSTPTQTVIFRRVACTHSLCCKEALYNCKSKVSGEGACGVKVLPRLPWAAGSSALWPCSRAGLPRTLCLGAGQERPERNLFSLIRAGSGLGFIMAVLHYKWLESLPKDFIPELLWDLTSCWMLLKRGGSTSKPAKAILHFWREQHHYHPLPGPLNHSCRCSWPEKVLFYIKRAAVADSVKTEDE